MYVVQCLSGKEAAVQQEVSAQGYMARVPTAIRFGLYGKRWVQRLQVLLPGYVFVDSTMHDELYHSVKSIDGVIRWLDPGQPARLVDEECEFIRCVTPYNLPIPPLEIELEPRPRVRTGPLAGLENKIVFMDQWKRKVLLSVTILGKEHTLPLSANFS